MYSGSRGTKAGDYSRGIFKVVGGDIQSRGKPKEPRANDSSLLSWLIQAYKFSQVTGF